MQNCDGCILCIEHSETVEVRTMDKVEGFIETANSDVVGKRSASEGSKSRENGSGDFYVTGGAACFLTVQSHHRY